MNSSLELLNSTVRTFSEDEPRLNLLYEPEPRFRLFLSNLSALVRPAPSFATTTPPGQFWPDVFIPSPVPWWSVMESIAYHMLLVMAVWGISLGSAPRKPLQQRRALAHSSITYYPPAFPTQASAPPRVKPKTQSPSRPGSSPHQAAMPVAPEHKSSPGALVTPPDLKAALAQPNLNPGHSPLPAVPVDATGRSTRAPAGLSSVVAPPPPEVSNSGIRAGGLPAASVVAPPPDFGGVSGHRPGSSGPGSAVVAPPPALQGSAHRLGALGVGSSSVVAPAPDLPTGQRSGLQAGRGLGGPGAIVPPPVQDAGTTGGNGGKRVGSLSGSGSQIVAPPPSLGAGTSGGPGGLMDPFVNNSAAVVPPPPSMQPGGGSARGRSFGALAGNGPQVVTPPPSLQSGGRAGGGAGRLSGLGGTGIQAVPPPPSLQAGRGAGAGQGGFGSFSGAGTQVVPPPPSVQPGAGINSFGSGHVGTLAGTETGTGIVPPPPAVQGGGGGGGGAGGGRLGRLGGSGTQVVPPPPGVQTVSTSNGTGGNGAAGGIGTLNGSGAQVVPPPPAVAGSAGGGSRAGGGLGNLGGADGQVAGPKGPVQMASTAGKPLLPLDDPPEAVPATPNQPSMTEAPQGPGEDVPLRIITMPVASTKTSFFSNYEVFLAERRTGKNQTEPIKLVYTFLPYQHRLSEYLAEGQVFKKKEYKLRVYRDTSCDESLLHMMWPDADEPPPNDNFAASLGIAKGKDNTQLPCFRLSADDYRRATMR